MHKLTITKDGWLCVKCNLYNDILTIHCKDCNSHRSHLLEDIARDVTFYRNPSRIQDGIDGEHMNDDMIELHAKFFNHERVLIKDMDNNTLRLHREELSKIIFEGRARLNAIDKEENERKVKMSPDGKSWLVSSSDVDSSKLIEGVKERKARMTKGDKLKDLFTNLGLDINEVNALMKPVENQSTDKQISSITFNSGKEKTSNTISEFCRIERHSECVGRFHSNGKSSECKCECHSVNGSVNSEPKEPFNPSKLFGS